MRNVPSENIPPTENESLVAALYTFSNPNPYDVKIVVK